MSEQLTAVGHARKLIELHRITLLGSYQEEQWIRLWRAAFTYVSELPAEALNIINELPLCDCDCLHKLRIHWYRSDVVFHRLPSEAERTAAEQLVLLVSTLEARRGEPRLERLSGGRMAIRIVEPEPINLT